jgi:hypothetical protein
MLKNYSNKLPRKISNKTKCQSLDIDGNKCNKIAKYEIYYNGDTEIYSYYNKESGPTWVCVNLCEECAGDRKK